MRPVAAVTLLLLLSLRDVQAQQFVPSTCRDTCRNALIQDISTSADDFLTIDPTVTNLSRSAFTATRVSTWAVALLKTLRMAVPPPVNQSVVITPPAVARLLGVYSLAVYQSYAVWSENVYAYGRYFAPVPSDAVNLAEPSRAAIWDALASPSEDIFASDFAPVEREATAAQQAAISGAASRFIELFFCNGTTPYWCNGATGVLGARAILNTTMTAVGQQDSIKYPAAFQQGAAIATESFTQFRMADLLRDNNSTLPADIASIAASQPIPTIHSCPSLTRGWWYWQRLTVPRSQAVFTPNISSPVFPPPSYASVPAATPIFRGFAAQMSGPALKSTSASREMLLTGLNGPPGQSDLPGLQAARQEVLDESATLNDAKKVIAEFWADGPESTTPPGHWYKIAIEESNINADFAIKSLNLLDRTVWATLNVGLALHEAGVLAWQLKVQYMGSRPITGIQCGLSPASSPGGSMFGSAWRGPYLGIGNRNLSTWQPFQAVNFTTPPFSGYVSGHATFSGAAAEALRQLRSGSNTSFTTPGYNCYKTPRGHSTIEPRTINSTTHPWHVPGVTDRANRGPRTPGFSPARDVIMCWKTYEEAAQQAAVSRMYGGIHIRIDNDDGLKLGKRIGENVAASLARLSPANFLVKAPVSFRAPPVGNPALQTSPLEDLLCPPGTFVRIVDGRADAAGLYYLGLTCSDGTFVGGQGFLGVEGTPFVISTVSDGFSGMTAGIQAGSVVSLSITRTDETQSDTYGMVTAEKVTSSCFDTDRIVGLSFQTNGRIGNLGAIGLLCDDCPVDTTYRTDHVPSLAQQPSLRETDWLYDHQCPDGTYITRFFGKAGTYVSTLTAQCARSWNLRDVGIPSYALETDTPFSHTSLNGYRGIVVKSFTGGVDCIQFINGTGGLSPMYGTTTFPGQPVTLSCEGSKDRIVGLHGWASAYVTSIGITCSSGQFTPLATSAKVLRRQRNPRQEPRLPGGYTITASIDAKGRVQVRPPIRVTTDVVPAAQRMGPKAVPIDTTHHHSNDTGLPLHEQQAGLLPNGANVVQEAGPVELQPQVEAGVAVAPPTGVAEQNAATPYQG